MERNIALVQERAKNDADLDDTWVDDEREHEDLQRQVNENCAFSFAVQVIHNFRLSICPIQLSSRNSSPDNDFVDVEGTERPHSSASASSQKFDGPSVIPAMPEIKRGRGRPRKNRDNLEEGTCNGCSCVAVECHVFFNFISSFLWKKNCQMECIQSLNLN